MAAIWKSKDVFSREMDWKRLQARGQEAWWRIRVTDGWRMATLKGMMPETSLAVQWLRLGFHCREYGFDPWSNNLDPVCHAGWPKKKLQWVWSQSPVCSWSTLWAGKDRIHLWKKQNGLQEKVSTHWKLRILQKQWVCNVLPLHSRPPVKTSTDTHTQNVWATMPHS